MQLNRTRTALYLLCISRAGLRPGVQLIEFIEDWQRIVAAARGPIGIERYSRLTRKISRRTGYTRLALFRKTFPELGPEGNPEGLMGPLLERLAAELDEETLRSDAAALGVHPDQLRNTRGYDPGAR